MLMLIVCGRRFVGIRSRIGQRTICARIMMMTMDYNAIIMMFIVHDGNL
jgi:hypothetical protein